MIRGVDIMRRLIIASTGKSAGRTTMIVGLARAMGKKVGYIKPFGERILYRKKRLLDHDSVVIRSILGIEDDPEEMSIGFDHSKLRYMYDSNTTREKLEEMACRAEKDRDMLIVEGGDLTYGSSVELDPISIAKTLEGSLVLVVSGQDDAILDDITFLNRNVRLDDVELKGVICNKVHDVEDFRLNYLPKVEEMGIEVLGVVPYRKELTYLTMDLISDSMFAKVLAGEGSLSNRVETILVGAQSTNSALSNPLFNKPGKLIITAGDRHDLVLASLGADTAGILLTNNILPSTKLISLAEERGIPLLLVSADTFRAAKQVDDMEPLLSPSNRERIELIGELVDSGLDLSRFD